MSSNISIILVTGDIDTAFRFTKESGIDLYCNKLKTGSQGKLVFEGARVFTTTISENKINKENLNNAIETLDSSENFDYFYIQSDSGSFDVKMINY